MRPVFRVVGAVDRPWEVAVNLAHLAGAGAGRGPVGDDRVDAVTLTDAELRLDKGDRSGPSRGPTSTPCSSTASRLVVLDRESRQLARDAGQAPDRRAVGRVPGARLPVAGRRPVRRAVPSLVAGHTRAAGGGQRGARRPGGGAEEEGRRGGARAARRGRRSSASRSATRAPAVLAPARPVMTPLAGAALEPGPDRRLRLRGDRPAGGGRGGDRRGGDRPGDRGRPVLVADAGGRRLCRAVVAAALAGRRGAAARADGRGHRVRGRRGAGRGLHGRREPALGRWRSRVAALHAVAGVPYSIVRPDPSSPCR